MLIRICDECHNECGKDDYISTDQSYSYPHKKPLDSKMFCGYLCLQIALSRAMHQALPDWVIAIPGKPVK